MRVESCAEAVDLSDVGIRHGSCIDPAMAEQILGVPIHVKKDKNQRPVCGCVESVETGAYDTCLCGCKYCYANDSEEAVKRRRAVYDADSPLLCGTVEEGDRITVRRTARIRSGE
jgi:DNA repair photolyase